MLKIVVDSKIPYSAEAFSPFARLRHTKAEDLTPEIARNADALLVRSESRVDGRLLDGSSVRFVGSCTIGTDHVDLQYLSSRNIAFANAPGCNARSVAEYVISSILETLPIRGRSLDDLRLGVVGCGNVGSHIVRFAEALGVQTLVNDPPLEAAGDSRRFCPLEEVLRCDVVTIHVPLERSGSYPTFHLIASPELNQMPDGALLINTSRGPVVDGPALLDELRETRLRAVLDVWENEPLPDLSLVKLADFGTPHIAGYSMDGKLRGTLMVYESLCSVFGRGGGWTGQGLLPRVRPVLLDLSRRQARDLELLQEAVRARYWITVDHRAMRPLLSLPADQRAQFFRGLRRTYPVRRELPSLTVRIDPERNRLAAMLEGLGVVLSRS